MDEEIEKILNPPDEETQELMEEHDLDRDQAECAQELIEEGMDEDIAAEIAQEE